MKQASKLTLVAALATLISLPVYAGSESSGGGADDYRIVSAFFRSYRAEIPVIACYEAIDHFGVDSAALEGIIRRGFKQWSDYLVQKKLTIVPSGNMILTHLELRDKCQGDENLTFYFGVENDLTRKYKSQYSKPYGFAQLTEEGGFSDVVTAKGFIWIAPSGAVDAVRAVPAWSPNTRDSLEGLVLHELGHVFGNGHVDGTVMTEKIGLYLEHDTAPGATSRNVALYARIDSQIELVPCMECRMTYMAAETFDPIQPPGDESASDWKRTFKLLVGHEPVLPMMIRYERLGSPQGSGKLTLADAENIYSFAVKILSLNGEHVDSTPLFAGQGGATFHAFGSSYFGQIEPLVGSPIYVTVNYNMDQKKATIASPLGGDFYPRPFFVSAD